MPLALLALLGIGAAFALAGRREEAPPGSPPALPPGLQPPPGAPTCLPPRQIPQVAVDWVAAMGPGLTFVAVLFIPTAQGWQILGVDGIMLDTLPPMGPNDFTGDAPPYTLGRVWAVPSGELVREAWYSDAPLPSQICGA